LDALKYMGASDSDTAVQPVTKLDKAQVNAMRRNRAKWDAYTTGTAYMLYYRNRTLDYSGRVQAYGSTPVDAVKRWYRGLDGNDRHTRNCVRVVAVHVCADTRTAQAGKLLMGTQQPSYPY
jgi:hypothetical protein